MRKRTILLETLACLDLYLEAQESLQRHLKQDDFIQMSQLGSVAKASRTAYEAYKKAIYIRTPYGKQKYVVDMSSSADMTAALNEVCEKTETLMKTISETGSFTLGMTEDLLDALINSQECVSIVRKLISDYMDLTREKYTRMDIKYEQKKLYGRM